MEMLQQEKKEYLFTSRADLIFMNGKTIKPRTKGNYTTLSDAVNIHLA